MPTPLAKSGPLVWTLPPLILHPFNERVPPSALLENSKAALMLSGLVPNDGSDPEDLRKRLLGGRFSEVRMLYFLGKDVLRWIDQCVEWAAGEPDLSDLTINRQALAHLLVQQTPEPVRDKLIRWGVSDYRSIFTRGIALNTLLAEPPEFHQLSADFLRNYHRCCDALYQIFLDAEEHPAMGGASFRFDLYASGEYSRMLESQWGESEA